MQTGKLEEALSVHAPHAAGDAESAEELRDRGLVYEKLECFRPALSDLQNYLRRRPDAPTPRRSATRSSEVRQSAARLN